MASTGRKKRKECTCPYCDIEFVDRKWLLKHIRDCGDRGTLLTNTIKESVRLHQCSDCLLCFGSRGTLTDHRNRKCEKEVDTASVSDAPDIDLDDIYRLFLVGSKPMRAPPKRLAKMTEAAASKVISRLINTIQNETVDERIATLAFTLFPFVLAHKSNYQTIREALVAIIDSDDPCTETITQLDTLGFFDSLRGEEQRRRERLHNPTDNIPTVDQIETPLEDKIKKAAERAKHLIYGGYLAKAAKVMEQPHSGEAPISTADISENVLSHLKALHPEADPLADVPIDVDHLPITAEEVLSALNAAKKGASVARSPWTAEFILAISQSSDSQFAPKLGKLLDLIAMGKPTCKDIWLCSRLVPIAKKDGGTRPLGIGDVITRLLGRILCTRATPDAVKQFGSIQLGYGVSDGVCVATHTIQTVADKVLSEGSDMIIISDDATAAFQNIDRKQIFNKLSSDFPLMANYFLWSYGEATDLIDNEGKTLCQSMKGVKQGDPIGSFCFDITTIDGLQEIYNKYKNEGVIIISVHDDNYFMGPHEATIAAFSEYGKILLDRFGVHRNLGKTVMLRGEHLADSTDNLLPHTRCTSDGLVAVGTPVGTAEYIEAKTLEMFAEFDMILKDTSDLSSELAIPILASVINSRPNFAARCISPDLMKRAADTHDDKMDDAIAKLCRVSGGHLDKIARTIRGLPTRHGGLGIRRLTDLCNDAYLAGYSNFLRFWRENDPTFLNFWLNGDTKMDRLCSNAIFPDDSSELDRSNQAHKQKDLARWRYTKQQLDLKNDLSDDQCRYRKAWFLSSSQPGCAAWIYSALQGPHLRISSSQYREALRLRLLCPVIENEPYRAHSCICGYAKHEQADGYYHATVCRTGNSQRTTCHDAAVRVLLNFLSKVQPDSHWALEENVGHGARADIVGIVDHQVYWVDVAITAPCTLHALAKRSDVYPLTAAWLREEQKMRHYEEARQAQQETAVTVVPFVIESTGAIGKCASEFIDTVCKLPRLLSIADSTLAIHRRNFKKLLNVCVIKGIAESLQAARKAVTTIPIITPNPPDVSDTSRTAASSNHLDIEDPD